MTRAGTVVLAGITVGYRETGAPSELPVVLLHATGSSARTWDRFASVLAEAGRYCIAVDLRGHGESTHLGEYTLDLMIADVLGFLEARGFPRIDLIGHSLGGAVALRLAAREPGRVRRLVIEDAPARLGIDGSDGRPLPPAEPPEPVDFDWRLVRPIFAELRTPDPTFWSQIPSITARTLLISGGSSSHIDPARIDELAAELPDAHVVLIDVGHRIHSTSPDEFAKVVVPFLTSAS